MTNANSNYNPSAKASAADPEEAPDFCGRYLEQLVESLQQGDPVFVRRQDLREWSSAAGFEDIDIRHRRDDCWEMRFRRGTNAECANVAEVERWLGYVARGGGCRIESGNFVAVLLEDRIAARFRLQPGPSPVQLRYGSKPLRALCDKTKRRHSRDARESVFSRTPRDPRFVDEDHTGAFNWPRHEMQARPHFCA